MRVASSGLAMVVMVEVVLAVRQKLGPARADDSLGRVGRDERLGDTSRGVHPPDGVVGAAVEEDHAVRRSRPRRPRWAHRRSPGRGRRPPAIRRSFPSGHEGDRPAVGRPERPQGALGAGQGPRLRGRPSGRIQICFFPVASTASKAIVRPSGETTGGPMSVMPSGFGIWKRTTGAGCWRPARPGHREADGGQAADRGGGPGRALAHPPPRGDDRGQSRARAALGDPLQLGHHVAGALPAVVGVLLQALADHVVEGGRAHRAARSRSPGAARRRWPRSGWCGSCPRRPCLPVAIS